MYPISYEADPALEGRNRLTVFFRGLVAIPWHIVMVLYGIGAFFAAVVAWFAIVFTGRYPEGLYDFNAGYLRMASRVNSWYWLLSDEWPPFGGEEAPNYPIRIGVPPALDTYDRLKTGLRLLFGIPVLILGWVQGLILEVCGIIAWFVILFTGKLPEGLFSAMRSASAYWTRASGYFLLITEDWPPFSLEQGGTPAAGQIDSESARTTPDA
ncbi:MAG TPA: DUF4389 domain-containing protein [Solirubrobacterales bacterium]|nr:DUF4389 domain-containing protein [Solirubrobacterales bacterium]